MGVILSDSPKLKSEIMKEGVLCCRHVLELDYLRENIDTESYKDNEEPINAFTYSIKEIPVLSEKLVYKDSPKSKSFCTNGSKH